MDRETIVRVAGVARIGLTDEEIGDFKDEIDKLSGILNTLDDAPGCDAFCFDPVGMTDALRDDIPVIDDTVEEMLRSMGTYDGFVRGPKIV